MKQVFFTMLFFGFLSCTNSQKVPDGVIPVSKIGAVLWDVMEADALVEHKQLFDTTLKRYDTSIQLYQQVLQIHHTNSEAFKKSIRFYQTRPDLLQIIFDSLQHRAEKPVIIDSTKVNQTV
jgi:hypothetical protein